MATKAKTTSTETTAYGFSKIANEILREKGFKELPAQMFYSYRAKGLLGTETKPLTKEFAVVWTEAYMEKKSARVAAAEAKVETELKGEAAEEASTEGVSLIKDRHRAPEETTTDSETEQEPVEAE
jgi:hypothetical protein